MLLFTRQAAIRPGKLTRALGFIPEVTSYASEKMGQEISCDMVTFGAPQGTVVWATGYEDMAQWADSSALLMADTTYLQMIDDAGDIWMGGSMLDTVRETIANFDLDAPAAFSQFNTATPAPGKIRGATEWGAEIASYAHEVTGQPMRFFADMYGTFGQLSWIAGFPDARALTDANAKLRSDPGYVERLERAGTNELFIPGSGRASMSRRIV